MTALRRPVHEAFTYEKTPEHRPSLHWGGIPAPDIPEGTELTFDLSVTDFGGQSDFTSVFATAP